MLQVQRASAGYHPSSADSRDTAAAADSPLACCPACGPPSLCSGVRDLYDMLQSPTFCHQLGYGVLEVCIVHLVPELKALFRTLQHGGLG